MPTVLEILNRTESFFAQRGVDAPKLSAQLLISDTLGLDRLQLFLNFDRPLSEEELEQLREPVRRRASGEPLAYIQGKREFWSLDFEVGPGVLIPRPDTETLVEATLAAIDGRLKAAAPRSDAPVELVLDSTEPAFDPDAPEVLVLDEPVTRWAEVEDAAEGDLEGEARVEGAGLDDEGEGGAVRAAQPDLTRDSQQPSDRATDSDTPLVFIADICAGSGCVGLALASERPEVRVYATDTSEQALGFLKKNIAAHSMEKRVAALQGDLMAPIPPKRPIDWVVSNPPYIATQVLAGLDVRKHEPELALDGGADGLDIYRRLVPEAARRARRGVLVEIGYDQGQAVAQIFRDAGLIDVIVKKDLGGRDRVVAGFVPQR